MRTEKPVYKALKCTKLEVDQKTELEKVVNEKLNNVNLAVVNEISVITKK